MARVLILGGGVAGTIVANRLARKLRYGEAEITVVDKTGQHVYQPGLLYLPLNQRDPRKITRPVRRLLDDRVELIEGTVEAIDLPAQSVQVRARSFSYVWLVLATGAELAQERVPGFHNAHHFYDLAHSIRLRETVREFKGGALSWDRRAKCTSVLLRHWSSSCSSMIIWRGGACGNEPSSIISRLFRKSFR
jgi:sulfide:quinone oxidoreductase